MQPWQLGAAEAAQLIRRKELSPVELAESCLDRVGQLDGELHAWVTVDADGALRAAAQLQDQPGSAGSPVPLAGVPVGVKDVIDVAGLPTTASSRILADAAPAAQDADCTGRLRGAGAVLLGKLHTAEFACADPPPTRNPWNTEHTPGGSSSGSGAAVAAGMVPAALGTQTGGSTLRPASYNGVVGLKATYGMISNRGVIPVGWSLDHVGIIARSVTDAALLLASAAGYDPLDPSSSPRASSFVPPAHMLSGSGGADQPPVIGLIRPYFLERCEPEVLRHTLEVAARLEAAGARVREISLPDSFGALVAGAPLIMRTEMYTYHREQFARWRDLYGPLNRALLDLGARTAAADYVLAARRRPGLVAELEQSLAGVDIALTPGTPAPAPRNTSTTGDASFQAPWTTAGLPAVALPSGVSQWGIPQGVQLIGHRWEDAALLGHALWCERVLGFAAHPPSWGTKTPLASVWQRAVEHGTSLTWADSPKLRPRHVPRVPRPAPPPRGPHGLVRGPRPWATASGTCGVSVGCGWSTWPR